MSKKRHNRKDNKSFFLSFFPSFPPGKRNESKMEEGPSPSIESYCLLSQMISVFIPVSGFVCSRSDRGRARADIEDTERDAFNGPAGSFVARMKNEKKVVMQFPGGEGSSGPNTAAAAAAAVVVAAAAAAAARRMGEEWTHDDILRPRGCNVRGKKRLVV